ncbi:MAG: hypothetical protein U0401_18310 [Anaerolineae bacterium]
MSTLQKFVFTIMMVAVLAMANIGLALADPINNPHAVHFVLTCDGQEFTVVSANEPTPTIHIVGETNTLIATEATLNTTFTDPQTGETITDSFTKVFGAGHGQAQGLQKRLITCTNTIIVDDPDVGPVTLELIATFMKTANN